MVVLSVASDESVKPAASAAQYVAAQKNIFVKSCSAANCCLLTSVKTMLI